MLQFSYLNNVTITGNLSNGGGGINHDGRTSGSYVHLENTIVVGTDARRPAVRLRHLGRGRDRLARATTWWGAAPAAPRTGPAT